MYFRYFVIISPCKRVGTLHLNKLESQSPKDALYQVWLKLAHWFWSNFFFYFLMNFRYFSIAIYKRVWPFIITNFNFLLPKMHCAKSGWNFPSNSGEEDFFYKSLKKVWLKLTQWFWRRRFSNFVNVFSLFRFYLPLKRTWPFIWTILKDALSQVWLKLSQWFWRRGFQISSMYFRYFVIISSWALPFYFNKLEFPLPKDDFCQVWLKLVQWFLSRRFFNFVNVFSLFVITPLGKGRGPSF